MFGFTAPVRSHLRLALLASAFFAAVAVSIVSPAGAGAATSASVHLRVEALADTLFNGAVTTGARSVNNTTLGTCTAEGATAAVASATPVTAAADAADAVGAANLNQYGGAYLCQFGAHVGGASQYWLTKVNNRTQKSPGDYYTGGSELDGGEEVLWYFTDDYAKPTLDLDLPPQVTAGAAVEGVVAKWDGSNDEQSAAVGAAIAGGGASATAGSDGRFSIAFPLPGTYVVAATLDGAVRASDVVDVVTTPVVPEPQPQIRVNRFKRCNKTYRKGTRRHRRCIRIVRAKQRIERSSRTADAH